MNYHTHRQIEVRIITIKCRCIPILTSSFVQQRALFYEKSHTHTHTHMKKYTRPRRLITDLSHDVRQTNLAHLNLITKHFVIN